MQQSYINKTDAEIVFNGRTVKPNDIITLPPSLEKRAARMGLVVSLADNSHSHSHLQGHGQVQAQEPAHKQDKEHEHPRDEQEIAAQVTIPATGKPKPKQGQPQTVVTSAPGAGEKKQD